jgi:hypothetical protein
VIGAQRELVRGSRMSGTGTRRRSACGSRSARLDAYTRAKDAGLDQLLIHGQPFARTALAIATRTE